MPQRIAVLRPLNYADVSTCARLTMLAFDLDPHTRVKQLGRDGYDLYPLFCNSLQKGIGSKKAVYVKAVDQDTGEIVGHAGWAFQRVDEALVPWIAPQDDPDTADIIVNDKTVSKQDEDKMQANDTAKEKDQQKIPDSIDRLHELEDRDMQYWVENIIPADKPCMIINGLMVAPAHQSRGIGRALIQRGNEIADKLGISIWVHSSHQAYDAYRKCGFKTMRVLDVDLDEYAPRPPRDDEPVMGDKGCEKWGRYIIRYLERRPVST